MCSGRPSLTMIAALPSAELVPREGQQLHRVFDQAGTGGESRRRNVLGARIIVLHRVQDPLIVQTSRFRDQVKLVSHREFDVAVGIVEQLCEFRLDRLEPTISGAIGPNSAAASSSASGEVPLIICGMLAELSMPWPWTMRSGQNATLRFRPLRVEITRRSIGSAGKERRPQHQQLTVAQIRQQRIDAVLDDVAHRIEKFVDRRADRHDHRAWVEISQGLLVKNRHLSAERLGEEFGCAPCSMNGNRPISAWPALSVEIIDIDGQAFGGERQHQRNADVSGAADHGEVGGSGQIGAAAAGKSATIQGFTPNVSTNERNRPMKLGANKAPSICIIDRATASARREEAT